MNQSIYSGEYDSKESRQEESYKKFQRLYKIRIKENSDEERQDDQFQLINFNEDIRICPEPLTFIRQLLGEQSFSEREIFLENILKEDNCKVRAIEGKDSSFTNEIWNNSTIDGVNLRPGFYANKMIDLKSIRLDDQAVHGLVAGVTGSGKSVLLNTMIMNLLFEYPAWELELYLMDFKKVEFSRYLSTVQTPGINAVGATEEVSYAVSIIKYIYDVMNARETLFAKLNQKHIKDFRRKYKVVLPRIVLIVDEFQQMYLDASTKEGSNINKYLTAITKKGRATGIHLLFASQEMSNTLPSNVKMNFKARIILPCTKEVSVDILGNKAGEKLEKYHALANTQSGDSDDNIKFQIPYIDTSLENESGFTAFEQLLNELKSFGDSFDFKKNHKYYEETTSDDIEKLIDLKNNKHVSNQISQILLSSEQYLESLILGPAVVYNSKNIDYESIFLEKTKNNHIACYSPRLRENAYLLNLLFINFYYAKNTYQHVVINRESGIYEQYPFKNRFEQVQETNPNKDQLRGVFSTDQEIIKQLSDYERRLVYKNALQNTSDVKGYFEMLIKDIKESQFLKTTEELSLLEKVLKSLPEKAIVSLEEVDPSLLKLSHLKIFSQFKKGEKTIEQLFPWRIYWIIGLENLDFIFRQLEKVAFSSASSVNTLFIFFSGNLDDARTREFMKKYCHYIFLSHATSTVYDKFKGNHTKRNDENIMVDLIISHLSQQKSFKKFNTNLDKLEIMSLDFDTLLGE
ncbi:FtsK/SpoIIIE domain-containing protein [Carnobacterium sp. TMP28]|uniref:FtsK/SpoIIIE domain-containing protein n=1 Tax=Carnobacterium sp. TMP28 TaxID=3397060 RepID=UPI0039DFC2EB